MAANRSETQKTPPSPKSLLFVFALLAAFAIASTLTIVYARHYKAETRAHREAESQRQTEAYDAKQARYQQRYDACHKQPISTYPSVEAWLRTCLEFELEERPQLDSLSLSARGIDQLPDIFDEYDLDHITTLYLDRNKLTDLPPSIASLTNLRRLILHTNHFTAIPPLAYKLPKLEELNMMDNHLTSVDDRINELKHLEALDLTINPSIKYWPKSWAGLERLRYLSLNDVGLTRVPTEIVTLPRLEHLGLSVNELTQLPPELSKISTLRSLTAIGNRLEEIPESFGQLRNLAFLNLTRNQLRTLPPILATLPQINRKPDIGPPIQHLQSYTERTILGKENTHRIRLDFNCTSPEYQDRCEELKEEGPDVDKITGIIVNNNAITTLDAAFCNIDWLKLDNNPLTPPTWQAQCNASQQ